MSTETLTAVQRAGLSAVLRAFVALEREEAREFLNRAPGDVVSDAQLSSIIAAASMALIKLERVAAVQAPPFLCEGADIRVHSDGIQEDAFRNPVSNHTAQKRADHVVYLGCSGLIGAHHLCTFCTITARHRRDYLGELTEAAFAKMRAAEADAIARGASSADALQLLPDQVRYRLTEGWHVTTGGASFAGRGRVEAW